MYPSTTSRGSPDMEGIVVGGTLEEMSKTIGKVFERSIFEQLQWNSKEDGPSYQENMSSSSRTDLRLSLGDGMKKNKGKTKVKWQDKKIKTGSSIVRHGRKNVEKRIRRICRE
ncbi:uncharacterized protein LOC134180396 isoform X5 [Corticium candelabrum]|uniref:uncharacterized protein LOC134180396 isoform X5 n=1 Tax=Corticium candelabrum TaxID=121492 RepID=UPI002E26EA01|nr:uncharacterized protein LOC134180396 isoform X5 [Corticium candelabrum]